MSGAPEVDDKVEITPAMRDAGELILKTTLGGALTIFWHPDDLAASVYEAMDLARQGMPLEEIDERRYRPRSGPAA